MKQERPVLTSTKLPEKEPHKGICAVKVSSAASILGVALNDYKRRTDISIVNDSSSLPPIALIASDSFLELNNQSPGCLITPESFLIPLLLLDTKQDEDRETAVKITAELEAAREISGVWPVAVVHLSELQTEERFLTTLHTLIAQASELLVEIRTDCINEKEHNACANYLFESMTTNPPMEQMILANMGIFFCEHLMQLDNELSYSWSKLISIWNGIVNLCDVKESQLLTANGQKSTELPNILHWFVRGFHRSVSSIRIELEARKKSSNSNLSKFAKKSLEVLDNSLPLNLRIVTNQIQSFRFQTTETVNASNRAGKTSIKESHSLEDILNIQLIKPSDMNFKAGFEVEDCPTIILMPNSHDQYGELIPPECSVKWIHELSTPYEGDVVWIGPGSIAVQDSANGRVAVCQVTDSQPMSYLALGDSVVAGQTLLFTASNANQVSINRTENLHQQEKAYDTKSLETSAVRTMLLETALQCKGENELFIGDLASAEPIVPNSSELISRLLVPLDRRAGWRTLPLQSLRTNDFRSGYPGVKAFRRSLMRPVRRVRLMLLKQLLQYDNDAVSSSITLLNKSINNLRKVEGDIMENEHLALLSGCLVLFTKLSKTLESKAEFLIAPQDREQALLYLKERIGIAKNERKPDPKTYPHKYQHVEEALESVDKCFASGRKSLKLLIEFIKNLAQALNMPISKIELPKANYFVEKYWKEEILKFPEKCPDFINVGASGDRKTRGNWLHGRFVMINTKLEKDTGNWTCYAKLNQALAECRGAIERIKIRLERNEKAAKDTLKILKVCREKLIIKEKEYTESLSLANNTLKILNNSNDLWEVFE